MYYLAISLFISTIQSCTTKVSVSLFSFSSFSRFNVLTLIVSERFLAFPPRATDVPVRGRASVSISAAAVAIT